MKLVLLTISAKPGWSLGYASAVDAKGEQSGVLTRIAAESVSVLHADEKLLELEFAIRRH